MPSPATPATPADSFGRRLLGAVAVGSLLASVTMVPIATAARPPVDAGPVDLGAPSIHYEEAMAHAGDRIAFEPGGRVKVGFRPRPGTADVAGQRSRPLPAGRASGHEMAAAPQGSVWTPVGSEGDRHPIDGPAVDAGSVVLEADLTAAHDLAGLEPAATLVATAGLRREVFGFLPYWQLNSSSLRLDYDLLSTIAYFSVPADRAGNLVKRNSDGTIATGWAGWTSSRLTSVIDAAHARGTRVVLTVTMFAWTTAQRSAQAAFLGDETARRNLARQAAAAVRDRGADGINLDFEPIASGYAEEYAAFVRDVRRELDAIAPGYQLTVDTTGHIGNYPLEELVAPGAADAIFIMGYDYRTAGADYAGSIAPLAGPAYDLTDTVRAYVARVPASALILGVPYYGRAWSTVSDALNAQTRSDSRYGSSVTAVYTTAVSLAAQYGRRYDSTEHSPWTAYRRQYCSSSGCVTTWRQLYYDDAVSLSRKYDLINRYGLRGAGIWALGYDGTRTELYAKIDEKFATAEADAEPASLSASSRVVTWGRPVTIEVDRGSAEAGTSVDLWASRDRSAWTRIATVTLDAAGRGSVTYTPVTNLYYRLSPLGASEPAAGDEVRVVARQIALLRPTNGGSVATVRRNSSVTFTTTVRPSRPELARATVRFVVYRRLATGWRLVTSRDVVADETGVARLRWTFTSVGDWYVRSMALPTPYNANSVWSPVERYEVDY